MEQLSRDARPSVLIVEPDNQLRSLLEAFFSRAGLQCKSWNGDGTHVPWKAGHAFDIVIADSLSLELASWKDLRNQQKQNPDSALVLLVNPDQQAEGDSDQGVLCCIERDSAPRSIESTLISLVEEYRRVRNEGRLPIRPRVPMEAQITIESFTSLELAQNTFPFPILMQLHNAGLLNVKEKLKLQLALEEALANSLEHGNLELQSIWKEEVDQHGADRYSQIKKERLGISEYAERIVTIVSDFDCDRLLIRITDQGKGFVPSHKKTVEIKQEAPAVFGRGMALMERTVDDVTYSCGGRQISLMKKIVQTKD